ncbi:hypothetical protein HII36_52885, partial [Nonomuraea sp. NN258]|uniref:hypothetical protein n=1 Tax=Nonomuraea antri TaxID=2730852 RepID=UPI00156A274C
RETRAAGDGFRAALETKACAATDSDVVLDLEQVARGVRASGSPSALASLRRKLADREREGRLSRACRTALESHLDDFAPP